MTRSIAVIGAVSIACCVAGALGWQPAPAPQPVEPPPQSLPPAESPAASPPAEPAPAATPATGLNAIPVDRLSEKLAALAPSDPMAYFRLGEEVAAEAFDRPSRDLARTLFVLAMHLDREQGGKLHLTPSACLALATLTPSESERRWLAAMASASDTRADAQERQARLPPAVSESVALELATTLGLLRAGEGRRAEQSLAKPAVAELLGAYENVLNDEGHLGGISRLRQIAAQWPCPECRNRRVVTRGEGGKPRLCPTCGGVPGPRLQRSELIVHLRMESALLRGIHRLWSAQALADNNQPLREADPNELAAWYKVDTTRTVWRAGDWKTP